MSARTTTDDTRRSLDVRLLAVDPPARRRLAVAIAAELLATLCVVIGALLVSAVVSMVFLAGAGLGAVLPMLALAFVVALGRGALVALGLRAADAAADGVKTHLRNTLTDQVLALGPVAVGRERSGDLVATMTDGITAIDGFIRSFQPARWSAVAVPVLVCVVVLVLDPLSAVVLIVTGPVLVLLLAAIGGRTGVLADRRFAELRWLSAYFVDVLAGMATLKAFGRSREQVDTIGAMSRRFGDASMDVLRTAFQTSLVLEWGGAVAVALVAVEISLRLMDGAIAFERALAVLIIVPEFFLPLRRLATRYHLGADGRAAAVRVFDLLDRPIVAAPTSPPPGRQPRPDDTIRFDDVTVTYPGRNEPALRGLDVTIPAGSTVALVGATGAGKSTIVNLLLQFLDPDSGVITVGGADLADSPPADWRRGVAWVPQRPHWFDGTIRDNIRLGRPEASRAEVVAAAVAAEAAGFIEALPLGYDTPVGEGANRLSGGERQRLAIARAFLADAPLVLLDEPTSHLDPRSEADLRTAVRRLAGGRTMVIVSHRLRFVADADLVVVVDAGRVVETGTSAALLAVDGPYRRLMGTLATEVAW